MSHSDIHKTQAVPRWAEYKRLLRGAARLTRNKLVSMRAPPLEAKLVLLRSIARAVHFNDVRPARALLASGPLPAELLSVSSEQVVSLVWPMDFRRKYEALQQEISEDRVR
eukprot:5606739-Pyramimonas_sp.AAC.1